MTEETKAVVSVVMGSDSDYPVMENAVTTLRDFSIPCEVILTSAHRSPDRTATFAQKAAGRGIKVIIVGAGMAAHLAGVIAAQTSLPVFGVPIDSSSFFGLDALLSTVQMPGGVPVAAMSVGKAGAKNAALMAVRILALTDDDLHERLDDYITSLADNIEEKQKTIDEKSGNS